MSLSQEKELMFMRYTITGRNIEVTPGLKAAVEKKIGKLEHFFTPDTEVIVALSAQKDRQKIEVTIPVNGQYHPCRRIQYRHVRIHRSGGGGY